MEGESRHIKYLIVIAAVFCAVIIGYNVFYVPDTDMTALIVSAEYSSVPDAVSSCGENSDNEEYVPLPAGSSASASASSLLESVSSGSENVQSMDEDKIDLNTATVEQLESLDGIGETLAERIIEYRQENGGFQSIEEIKNVSGIGDKKFDAIKNSVTCG